MDNLEKRAMEVYNTLCNALDKLNFHYTKEGRDSDGDYTIRFSATGEDLPMGFVMFADTDKQLVRLMSKLPFAFSANKRLEGAIVTCRANYRMIDGNFDYDYETGSIIFKVTTSYMSSLLDEELLLYMVRLACSMVDEFNDKFLAVDKGMMSVEDFLKKY